MSSETKDSEKLSFQDNNNDEMKMTTPSSPNKKQASNASSFKLLLLVLMVLQNSSTVLVGRYSRSSLPESELYVVNHLILVCECGKFILSCILEHFHTGNLWQSIQTNVLQKPLDALKIIIPSLLYLIQNSLLYIALSNLTAPLFQVTYQAKLVTTALVSVVMLKRRYSTQQWICLVVLSIGVAIVVLDKDSHKQQQQNNNNTTTTAANDNTSNKTPSQSLALGLLSVTIACLSSALAGVYFEKVLKTKTTTNTPPVSLWMRNIQMAFFSILIAMIQGLRLLEEEKPFFHGFTSWVWILVVLQAGGGLLVAAVIKYADNVLKGLATGVSVVVATVCSMVLFGTPLSFQFTSGATLILGAVYLFSNKLPGSSNNVVEMKPLVLPK